MSQEEAPEKRQARLALEKDCADLGRVIAKSLPSGVGFLLVTFDFGGQGSMAYMSNGSREDVIKMLAELREKLIESRQ